jgi:hypothetical protein
MSGKTKPSQFGPQKKSAATLRAQEKAAAKKCSKEKEKMSENEWPEGLPLTSEIPSCPHGEKK